MSPATEAKVRTISPRQIDRLLAPDQRTIRRRLYGRTKPGTLLKHHILVKTDHWDVTEPGFTEVDLLNAMGVAHKDHTIAAVVQAIGTLTMIAGLVWGAIVVLNQIRYIPAQPYGGALS